MDTIGPKDPAKKIPELTPPLHRFIEGMGLYFENQGIPRIGGRMLGLLMIAHWPLSRRGPGLHPADQPRQRLHQYPPSAKLRAGGEGAPAALCGRRTSYIRMRPWNTASPPALSRPRPSSGCWQQAAEAVPPRDPARHHIDDFDGLV